MPGHNYDNNPKKLSDATKPTNFNIKINIPPPNLTIPKNIVGNPAGTSNANTAKKAIDIRNKELLEELNQTIQKLNLFNNTKEPTNAKPVNYDPNVLLRIKSKMSMHHLQQKNIQQFSPELSSFHFQGYIKLYPDLQYKSLILGFNRYIINADGISLRQPEKNDVVEYLGKNIAEYKISNNNNPLSQPEVMRWIKSLKDFFDWVEFKYKCNNVAKDISYEEVQNKANIIYNAMPQSKSEDDVLKGQTFVFQWAEIYLEEVKNEKGDEFDQGAAARLNRFIDHLKATSNIKPTSKDINDFLINNVKLNSESSINVYLSTLNNFFQWTASKTKKQKDIYYPNIKIYCLPYTQIKDLIDNRIATQKAKLKEDLKTASLDPQCIDTFVTDAETSPTIKFNLISRAIIRSFKEYLIEFNIKKPLDTDVLIFLGKYRNTLVDSYIKHALPTISKFFQWTSTHKDQEGKILYPDISLLIPTYEQTCLFIKNIRDERDQKIGNLDFNLAYFDEFIRDFKNPNGEAIDEQSKTRMTALQKYFSDEEVQKPEYKNIINFFVQRESLKTESAMKEYLKIFQKFFRWTWIKTREDGQMYYPDIASNMPTPSILKIIVENERAKQK